MEHLTDHEDDYLRCREYQTISPGDDGFHRFEKDGLFYFSFIDHGIVVLRSEGYTTEKSRENGIESVRKNMDDDNNYSVISLPGGRHALSLKAQNGKEIARSCAEDTEEGARSFLPSSRKEFAAEFLRLASVEAGTVPQANVAFVGNTHESVANITPISAETENVSTIETDNYMTCRQYQERADIEMADSKGFVRFKNEKEGEYYFAWVGADNKVIMRSEGYATEVSRDKGIESVIKNRENRDRFKVIEKHGAFFLILKAGNHQEIARSCGAESEAELWALIGTYKGLSSTVEDVTPIVESTLSTVIDSENAIHLAGASATENVSTIETDDYMVCSQYQERADIEVADSNGFVRFQNEKSGEYYFAWVGADNKVIMRSEGYATDASREKGIESVIKNRENRDRYKVIEKHGAFFLILKAGNHQEIARSCGAESEAELWALIGTFDGLSSGVEKITPMPGSTLTAVTDSENSSHLAGAAATALAAGLMSQPEDKETKYKEKDKDDDYLHCDDYKGYTVADKANHIAFFKHKNGQYYFVVYNQNGSVKLRSEGFKTSAERDQELKGVIKYINDPKMYSTIERAGFVIHILKDKTGREVGRSCPEKNVPVAAAIVEPHKVDTVVTPLKEAKVPVTNFNEPSLVPGSEPAGFNWKWLLPFLLLLPLFFWWKSCNKKTLDADLSGEMGQIETPVAQDTIKTETAPASAITSAPVVDAPSCDLNWILFDYDSYNIKQQANDELRVMVKILKDNPAYKGVLRAFTDAKGSDDYNQRLSLNRADAAKAVLVSAGIDESRISTSANSEAAPIAENTDDDSGRRYNRRVELYIQDAAGKDICKSIPPSVPSNLKK